MAELEATLGTRELQDWLRYWEVEPWGAWRDNLHAGLIAAATLQPHIKRGKRPPTWKDFMLRDAATAAAERKANTGRALAGLMAMAKRKPRKPKDSTP